MQFHDNIVHRKSCVQVKSHKLSSFHWIKSMLWGLHSMKSLERQLYSIDQKGVFFVYFTDTYCFYLLVALWLFLILPFFSLSPLTFCHAFLLSLSHLIRTPSDASAGLFATADSIDCKTSAKFIKLPLFRWNPIPTSPFIVVNGLGQTIAMQYLALYTSMFLYCHKRLLSPIVCFVPSAMCSKRPTFHIWNFSI